MALSDGTAKRIDVALGSPAAGSEVTAAINALATIGVTPGTVAASSAVIVDASKDVSGFRNIGLTGTITPSTSTGVSFVAMTDNLAAAFGFKEGSNVYLAFKTTNGSEAVLVGQNLSMTDAKNIVLDTTTGTKLGTSASQKLGLWDATPVIQQASANQAALSAQGQQALTDNSGGAASTTLASISDTATKNAVASLAAQLALVKTDVAAVFTLLTAIRSALVTIGAIKGAA